MISLRRLVRIIPLVYTASGLLGAEPSPRGPVPELTPLTPPSKGTSNRVVLTPIKATFLPQVHDLWDREVDVRSQDLIVQSQFAIANYLEKHTNALIITEGLSHNLKRGDAIKDPKRAESVRIVQQTFPRGIPDSLKDLSPDQQEILGTVGAAPVLLYLGILSELHPSITPTAAALSDNATKALEAHCEAKGIDPFSLFSYRFFVCTFRELELMNAVVKAHAAERLGAGREIIIVYGAGHADTFPPQLSQVVRATIADGFTVSSVPKLAAQLAEDRRVPFPKQLERARQEFQDLLLPRK